MKKIISMLVVVTLIFTMSSVVSFAAVGDSILSLNTFDHQDEGFVYQKQITDSCGWNLNHSDNVTNVTIESESGNNVAKITNSGYVEFYNSWLNPLKVSAPKICISYRVKFSDKNTDRHLQLRTIDGVSGNIIKYAKDGTIGVGDSSSRRNLKNASGTDFVYNTNTWYSVEVMLDSTNKLIELKLNDGTNTYRTSNKITKVYTTPNMLYFYNGAASSGTSSSMYIDDVKITEGGSVSAVMLDFNNHSVADTTSDLVGTAFTSGITPAYSYVDRGNGDMAFKLDLPNGTGYWQAQKYSDGVEFTSGVVLVETDIYMPERNCSRRLCVRKDGIQTAIVKFEADGAIGVGSTKYSDAFTYETGAQAPWYHVKAYYNIDNQKIRAEISDGTNTKVFYGALSSGGKINAVEYLIMSVSTSGSAVSTYFDNMSLSSYVNGDADFFTPDYIYDFDSISQLKGYGAGYNNDGWYVQNVKNGDEIVATATPAEIDGRKALKLSSLGQTHFEVLNRMPARDITRYSADIRVDDSSAVRLVIRGEKSDKSEDVITLATINDYKVALAGGSELGTIAAKKWFRYAYSFDATNKTYTLKLIDLENNTSVKSTSITIPGDITTITAIEFYLPQSANTVYLDNVCYSGNTTFKVLSDTTDNSTVDAAFGAEVTTNDMIDPSATTYILNGANNGAWVDANGIGKAEFSYLEPNTEYTLNYTVANLYGQTVSGTITFTTAAEGYGFKDLKLSKEVVSSGEISASVSGRLARGEEAQLIIAVYEKNGSMELVEVKTVSIDKVKENKNYSATIAIPDDGNTYAVKAFLWDANKPLLVNVGI